MTALYQVLDGDDAAAADLEQYRALFRGAHMYDVLNGFAAAGDGVTDDWSIVQAAINTAHANGGGIVFFAPGHTFLLSAKLTIYDDVYLLGPGATLKASTATNVIYGTGIRHAVVDGLHINGNQTVAGGASDADAILFEGASVGCAVINCEVEKSARDGIAFRGTSRGCAAIGNYVHDAREDGITINGEAHRIIGNHLKNIWGDGILVKGSIRGTIAGNTIDSPGTGGSGAGVSLGGDGVAANDYNAVTGNTCVGATGASFFIQQAKCTTISGNTIKDGLSTGIWLSTADDCSVVGNVVDNMSGVGIDASVGLRPVIASNVVSRSGNSGIKVRSAATGAIIKGNSINTAASNGIESTVDDATIEGNTVQGITVAATNGIRSTGNAAVISGNRLISPKLHGIYHSTGVRPQIIGNRVTTAGGRGIFNDGGTNSVINNNLVRNSGQDGVSPEGIMLNNVIGGTIVGNMSYDDQGTHTQTYGVRSLGTSDRQACVGNSTWTGNTVAGIGLLGANNSIANNT